MKKLLLALALAGAACGKPADAPQPSPSASSSSAPQPRSRKSPVEHDRSKPYLDDTRVQGIVKVMRDHEDPSRWYILAAGEGTGLAHLQKMDDACARYGFADQYDYLESLARVGAIKASIEQAATYDAQIAEREKQFGRPDATDAQRKTHREAINVLKKARANLFLRTCPADIDAYRRHEADLVAAWRTPKRP